MASNTMPHPGDIKESEAMQQALSAPPMGPPPTYLEAMNSSPYPAMPVPAAYPTTNTAMPLPQQLSSPPPTAPYPIDDNVIAQSMTQVQPAHAPLSDTHFHSAINYNNSEPPAPPIHHHPGYQQPIVNQPAAYNDEYVHPKTTYVVLQDERNRRRNDDDECSCTDWLMCCWCCVETCRCMLLCLECAATCK